MRQTYVLRHVLIPIRSNSLSHIQVAGTFAACNFSRASSTVICVLLLLLWALHQRRFSLVAGQLRLIQRRCFSPPAALYMSLVYSFFPLSGAIAW